jgi:type VI secretion system protein ImpL
MIRQFFVLMLALILCAVIWWVGPLIAIGQWRPLAYIWPRGILIALILLWLIWPWMWRLGARIGAKARGNSAARPAVQPRDSRQQRFYDAIATLKYVFLSEQRHGWHRLMARLRRPWLTDRPWFLILGPDNSGKTSLLSESQQHFLLAEQFGLRATTSPGNTPDVNWWLSREAVWIDTPGEWSQPSPESDKARSKLMRLLRRFRGYPPIDGIFLCLSAPALLHSSLTEHKALVDTLRSRLLDCAAEANCDLPVYLMLTHIDELPGGKTLLYMMNESLIEQGIGFSLDNQQQDLAVALQDLQSRMSQYVLELLHDVNAEEERQQLLELVETLGILSTPLRSLISQIFPTKPVGYIPQLRHLWLGSSAISHQEVQGAGAWVAAQVSQSTSGIWQASFKHAIRERFVLSAGRQHVPGNIRLRRALLWLLVVALLGGGTLGLLNRYQWEKEYASYLGATFDETRRLVREVPASQRPADNLIAAYEQLGYINAQLVDITTPVANPYIEHRLLNDAATATWHRHLQKIFWPAVESYVISTLQQETQSQEGDIYGTLKVYMMLVEPEHRDSAAVTDWFLARWRQFAPAGYTDNNRLLFGFHLKELFSLANLPATKRDNNLVRLARVRAAEIPPQQRVLNRLQESRKITALPDITLASAAGNDVVLALRRKSNTTVSDVAVPKFYTRASYRDIVIPELSGMSNTVLNEESWVLNDSADKSTLKSVTSAQRLTDEARKLYLLEYANHWAMFMDDIRARPIQGIDDAAQLARQLADPSSPLANLIRFVTRETSLSGRDDAGATSWFDRQRFNLEKQKRDIVDEISGERSRFQLTPEVAVEDRFQPLRRLGLELAKSTGGNDGMIRAFNEFYNQLAALAVRLRGGETAAQDGTLNRMRIEAARQPEPVRSVMMDLISLTESQSTEQRKKAISRSTASIAAGECKAALANRYPFARNARNEVGIDDFSRLFGRSGALQSFFDQNLAPLVDMNQRPWRAKQEGMISNSTLRSFENAAKIRDSWFQQGNTPSFSFFISPVVLSSNIAEAVLDIDGQIVRYSHGQSQPVRMNWPGTKGGSYVRLTFQTLDGSIQTSLFEGPWSLFRFYDAATVTSQKADTRELTIMLSGTPGSYSFNIRAAQQDFPLWSRTLRNFECP